MKRASTNIDTLAVSTTLELPTLAPTTAFITSPHSNGAVLERDSMLYYEANTHTYEMATVQKKGVTHALLANNRVTLLSVTRYLDELFKPFDTAAVITRMMRGRNWPQHALYGRTAAEIEAIWAARCNLGTALHETIEMFYESPDTVLDAVAMQDPCWLQFKRFHADHKEWQIYRTEWRVFCESLKLAGTIDAVFTTPATRSATKSGGPLHVVLVDWKRSARFRYTNCWQTGIVDCTRSLPDTNFWHHTLQLCLYRKLLEAHYNVVVDDMWLVRFHPSLSSSVCKDNCHIINDAPTTLIPTPTHRYEMCRVKWDRDRMNQVVAHRLRQVLVS